MPLAQLKVAPDDIGNRVCGYANSIVPVEPTDGVSDLKLLVSRVR